MAENTQKPGRFNLPHTEILSAHNVTVVGHNVCPITAVLTGRVRIYLTHLRSTHLHLGKN